MSDTQGATSYASSIFALMLGIGPAVGVSALFGVIGWATKPPPPSVRKLEAD